MQVIGFGFTKILAQRAITLAEKIDIKSNINIASIERTQSDTFKDKDLLKFDFEYELNFAKDTGKVAFGGFIILAVDEDKASSILKDWKKKQIEENLKIALFNLIMDKTHVKALQLEEDLRLPHHIPHPMLVAKPKEEAKESGKPEDESKKK